MNSKNNNKAVLGGGGTDRLSAPGTPGTTGAREGEGEGEGKGEEGEGKGEGEGAREGRSENSVDDCADGAQGQVVKKKTTARAKIQRTTTNDGLYVVRPAKKTTHRRKKTVN